MSIMDIILTGLAWIITVTIIITLIGGFFLLTWMQVNDERSNSDEREAKAPEGGSADPAEKRRRRRTACGYQGQVS